MGIDRSRFTTDQSEKNGLFETESQWGNGGNGATFVPGRGWITSPQKKRKEQQQKPGLMESLKHWVFDGEMTLTEVRIRTFLETIRKVWAIIQRDRKTNWIQHMAQLIWAMTQILALIRDFKHWYDERELERDRRLCHEWLESQRDDIPDFFSENGTVALRGMLFLENLLKRSSPRRKEHYIEELRFYRVMLLNWSTRRAAEEAKIGHSSYKRIEGIKVDKPHIDSLALICTAFKASPERLGFAYYYQGEHLEQINREMRKLLEERQKAEVEARKKELSGKRGA